MELPPTVSALIESGRLPAVLAECFNPAETLSEYPDWIDIADVVDEHLASPDLDGDLLGPLALMGAYAHLDACEIMVDEIGERSRRALALLDQAAAHGVADAETAPLVGRADELAGLAQELAEKGIGEDAEAGELAAVEDQAWELYRSDAAASLRKAADLFRYIARHTFGDGAVLRWLVWEAEARYQAGDRAAALALARDIAYREYHADSISAVNDAWILMIRDAADHDGPDAVRSLWRAARAHHHLIPWPGVHCSLLVERLLGKNVPDVLAEVVAYQRAKGWDWLDSEGRRVMKLAQQEIDATR